MDTVQALERAREIIQASSRARETSAALHRITGYEPAPEDAAVRNALNAELDQLRRIAQTGIKQTLRGRERLVVECFYLEGATIGAIAQGIHVCAHTVKKTKAAALRRLKNAEESETSDEP